MPEGYMGRAAVQLSGAQLPCELVWLMQQRDALSQNGCEWRPFAQVAHGDSDVDAASRALAQRTWPALKRSTKAGVRRTVRHLQQGSGFGVHWRSAPSRAEVYY